MRRVLGVFMLAACNHAGSSTPVVPIDKPPADTAAAAPEIEAVEGGAPASAPVGDPIAITYVPLTVGTVRLRALRMHEIYDTTIDGASHHQDSEHTYRVREEITALDGERVKTVRAAVLEAHERIVKDDQPNEMDLLDGTYIVDVGGGLKDHGAMSATHATGREVGSRELEELGLVFSSDANELGLVKIVRAHPLRLHESVLLTDAEKQLYVNGPLTDPLALTLVEVTGETAVYQLDMSHTEGGDALHLRERSRIRIATGQLVDSVMLTSNSEHSEGMTHDQRGKTELEFSIVPR